jgi:hypothetical protein
MLDLEARETESMTRSILAVLAGYLVFGVTAFLLFPLSGVDPHGEVSAGFAVLGTLYGMAFAFAGGFLAAVLARGAELAHGLAVAGIILVLATLSLLARLGEGSIWSEAVTLALMAPSAAAGGYVRRRTSSG